MSLVSLGRRTEVLDLVGMLAECHARIRKFLDIAARLASDPALTLEDIQRGAHDVRRYFAQALPEHVADEELLAALLAGRDPALDAVLATMRTDHAAHLEPVAALVAHCTTLERAPDRRRDLAPEIAALVVRLEGELIPHLGVEERELFPRLAALDDAERERLRREIRARRDRALGEVHP